jgi:hypothetical protein
MAIYIDGARSSQDDGEWSMLGSSALADYIAAVHDRMTQKQLYNLKRSLMKWRSKAIPFTMGTACSGTDLVVKVMELLIMHWSWRFGINFWDAFKHRFACENVTWKQEFIMAQFPGLPILFGELADLKESSAMNVISGSKKFVSGVTLFIAGFVCKSRSPANVHAKQNKGCVERGTEKTGESFKHCLGYITSHGVLCFLLENVRSLTDLNDADESTAYDCDADYITESFKAAGYTTKHVTLKASDYKSETERIRLFFLGFKGCDEGGRIMATLTSIISRLASDDCPPFPDFPKERARRLQPTHIPWSVIVSLLILLYISVDLSGTPHASAKMSVNSV